MKAWHAPFPINELTGCAGDGGGGGDISDLEKHGSLPPPPKMHLLNAPVEDDLRRLEHADERRWVGFPSQEMHQLGASVRGGRRRRWAS